MRTYSDDELSEWFDGGNLLLIVGHHLIDDAEVVIANITSEWNNRCGSLVLITIFRGNRVIE